MSRNGSLLAIPPGFDFPPYPLPSVYASYNGVWPRSAWLRATEDLLRAFYPLASTADLALTARTYAPFALAQPGQR